MTEGNSLFFVSIDFNLYRNPQPININELSAVKIPLFETLGHPGF